MSPTMHPWPRSPDEDLLDSARSVGVLSPLDHQFAKRLSTLYRESSASVRWALAIASRQESAGHVCADLHRLASAGLSVDFGGEVTTFPALATSESVELWIDELRESTLVEVVSSGAGDAIDPRPLVLDDKGRLYLRRAYLSQENLVEFVRARTSCPDLEVDWDLADAGIARLTTTGGPDDTLPGLALATALARPLAIVTGGPGTGKTTLVARLVALLIEQAFGHGRTPPRVRLLAPTGKAAAAMSSSFRHQSGTLDISQEVRAAMNVFAETVHRALYQQSRRDAFGRPRALSLDADLVVVDEASMVDLELMARLFDACQSVGRIVMLGDPSQLASVNSGAVLSELCARRSQDGVLARPDDHLGDDDDERPDRSTPTANFRRRSGARKPAKGLHDSIVRLRTSHRFAESGGIDQLAEAIRRGDANAVIEILDDPAIPEVDRAPIESIADVRADLMQMSRRVHREIASATAPIEKLEKMILYRVLCAHRRGPLGVEALCAVLDEGAAVERKAIRRAGWWAGRMVLVRRNAPDQDLWNGDVGLIDETPAGLRALFSDGRGGVRALSAGRLPSHESAIAMSVHKGQGSEFETVDLVLGDVMSRVITRELIYTGVTRARSRLRIHASESVLRDGVERPVSRDSGLGERLWAD